MTKAILMYIAVFALTGISFCACKKKSDPVIITPPFQSLKYEFEQQPSWQEEFNGTSLNLNVWKLHAPGIRQDGYNDTAGMSFDGNNFVNKVYSDTVSGVVTHHAGMIRTIQEFKYGKFEAKISFVNKSGSWSAFWIQSPTMGNPVGSPQTAGMEIDVVETLTNDGAAHHNLHWDGYGTDHKTAGLTTGNLGVNSGNYHIFTLEWTPAYYKFYVDGNLTWTYTSNISQRSEFIILSSEVKNYTTGSWAGAFTPGGFGSLEKTAVVMKVDYVKVYNLKL